MATPASPTPQAPAASAKPDAATTLLEQLRKHLENELAVQQRLLVIAEQMAPKLMAGDAQGVAALVASQDEPAREAARLSTIRQRLAQALASVFRIAGEVTLTLVLQQAPEAIRRELERLRKEVVQVCQRLGRQSERNLAVARQGLSLIRDVLGDAVGARPVQAYDRRGMIGTPSAMRGSVVNFRY